MQRVGKVGALVVGVIGTLVLIGWYLHVRVLTTVLPGYASMKPNTALALVAIALAVTMLRRSRASVPLGVFATMLGSATLVEYVLGQSLGIDLLLPGIDLGGDAPRMAQATAVSVVLLGSAVIAAGRGRTRLMRGLAVAALGVGQIALLGYAYGVYSLYSVAGFTSMAVQTALSVTVLSLSILLLDPSAALIGLLRDRGSVGRLVRPMFPFIFLGPFILGWLRLWAQRQGWFDTTFGVAALVMSMTILGGMVIWLASISLRDLDRQRDEAVQALAETNRTLESTVAQRTRELAQRQGFLDALLETVEVGIMSCDAQGRTLVRNRAERAMAGLGDAAPGPVPDGAAPEIDFLELDGRPLTTGEYPLMRALHGEDVVGVELLLGPPGGPYREVLVHGDRITGPGDEVLGAVVSVTDVTSERSVARALASERSNLEEAQRLGQLGSFKYDAGTGAWAFSDQLCALWGVGPGGLVPEVTQRLIHDQDREGAWHSWREALGVSGEHSHQYRIHRADDGAERLIRSIVEIRLGPDGQLQHGRGTHLDITDLTSAQHSAQKANAFLEAVLAATPDYTYVTDLATGGVLYGSPGKQILGRTMEELQALGSEVAKLIHPEDLPRVRAANVAAADLVTGQVQQLIYRARSLDGRWCWLSRRVTPFRRDASGTVVEVLGVTRDVTDIVEAEDHLRYVALHDSLTGLPNRALLVERLDAALARCSRDGHEVAVLYCDLDGFKRVNDTAGHAAGDTVLVETARRLQSVVRAEDTVARVGGDEFVIVLEPFNRAVPTDQPYKPGAQLGPLSPLSPLSPLGPPRPLGPPGSRGQFGATFPDVDDVRDLAVQVALRIIEAVGAPIEISDVEHLVTASVGIAYAKASPGGSAEAVASNQLLDDADAAMYQAKHHGKDRFEVFEPVLRTDLAERGRVERVLRQALQQSGIPARAVTASTRTAAPRTEVSRTECNRTEGNRTEGNRTEGTSLLSVAYQPVFCSLTGALVSFEALARLTDAGGLDIPPDVFIRVAEDVGLIRPLGSIILDLACRQLAIWRAQTPGLEKVTMSVNVSALQAQHSSLGADVRQALTAHKLAATDLILELTETALLHAAHSTITALRALRDEGVGIAIDDFGTGYSSLRYLAMLPVTAIKIDKSFVAALPDDQTSAKIVRAVVGLAADLDLTCVIEGIETQTQRNALPAGVHLQGGLTGGPQPPDKLDLLRLVALGAPTIVVTL